MKWESEASHGTDLWLNHPGLFEPYCRAGRVYLLLDGLDEFFVRRRDEVERLVEEISDARRNGIHIVLACRENLWVQQFRGPKPFRTLRILAFNQAEAMRLLHNIDIPQNARDDHGGLKEWLLNPLLLGFLQDLSRRGGKFVRFDSRKELYENWAREALGGATSSRLGIDSEYLLTFMGRVAIALLRGRKRHLSLNDVKALIPTTFKEPFPRTEQVLHAEVLRQREDGETEFSHESIYEFFVARALRQDFLIAADALPSSGGSLDRLPLAEVELDFPQSSVYGFLQEMLGTTFVDRIHGRLSTLATRNHSWRLVRNVIEYVGMTYEDGCVRNVATSLMSIAQDDQLMGRVRYDALRALERIHPGAPRPYFRHVSDWGPLDYSQMVVRESVPWVMRGYGKNAPQPGRHWSWTPNRCQNPDGDLHVEISHRLGGLIRACLESFGRGTNADDSVEGILINASHAWIRWFHPKDRPTLEGVHAQAAELGLDETRENLRWICGDLPLKRRRLRRP